jgi:hypothetical protein
MALLNTAIFGNSQVAAQLSVSSEHMAQLFVYVPSHEDVCSWLLHYCRFRQNTCLSCLVTYRAMKASVVGSCTNVSFVRTHGLVVWLRTEPWRWVQVAPALLPVSSEHVAQLFAYVPSHEDECRWLMCYCRFRQNTWLSCFLTYRAMKMSAGGSCATVGFVRTHGSVVFLRTEPWRCVQVAPARLQCTYIYRRDTAIRFLSY